jgi:hypothetical protein
LSAPE